MCVQYTEWYNSACFFIASVTDLFFPFSISNFSFVRSFLFIFGILYLTKPMFLLLLLLFMLVSPTLLFYFYFPAQSAHALVLQSAWKHEQMSQNSVLRSINPIFGSCRSCWFGTQPLGLNSRWNRHQYCCDFLYSDWIFPDLTFMLRISVEFEFYIKFDFFTSKISRKRSIDLVCVFISKFWQAFWKLWEKWACVKATLNEIMILWMNVWLNWRWCVFGKPVNMFECKSLSKWMYSLFYNLVFSVHCFDVKQTTIIFEIMH